MDASEARDKSRKAKLRKNKETTLARNKLERERDCEVRRGRKDYKEFYNLVLEGVECAAKAGIYSCKRSLGGRTERTSPYEYGQVSRTMEVLRESGFTVEYYESTGRDWSEDTTYYCGVNVSWQ